jgi:hypothetical protein
MYNYYSSLGQRFDILTDQDLNLDILERLVLFGGYAPAALEV